MANQKNLEIICTAYSKGKEHDFSLFKKSRVSMSKEIKCLGDKGYEGITKIHSNSKTPQKKPKKAELNEEQKNDNKKLASERIVVEHIYCQLKVFKIISSRYRNRRKRFGLRFNLLAGLYNYEVHLLNQLKM